MIHLQVSVSPAVEMCVHPFVHTWFPIENFIYGRIFSNFAYIFISGWIVWDCKWAKSVIFDRVAALDF